MRIVVRRKDTGEFLYPTSWRKPDWGPDLQEARLFTTRSAATNAGRTALPHGSFSRASYGKPRAPKDGTPELENVEVSLALKVAA